MMGEAKKIVEQFRQGIDLAELSDHSKETESNH